MGDVIPTFPGVANPKAALVDYIMERHRDAEVGDRPFKERALANWLAFNSKLPENIRGFSSIYDPQTYGATTGTVDQWMGNIFSKERVFDLEPLGGQDDLQTEIMRELMDYVLREHIRYKLGLNFQAMEGTLFGNAVVQHDWADYHVPGMRGRWGMTGEGRKETWPRRTLKSRFDVFPARTGATIQAMPYFLTRTLMPLEQLKAEAATAGYDAETIEKLEKEAFTMDGKDVSFMGGSEERLLDLWELLKSVGYDVKGANGTDSGSQAAMKYVEVMTYTERPTSRDGGAWQAMVANRLLFLKAGPNPFWHGLKPYSEIKFAPMLGHFWQAWGLPEIVEPIQMVLNIRQNQYSDLLDLTRSPMWLVGQMAGIEDLTTLADWPGATVRCADPNAIRALDRPAAPVELLRSLDHLYSQFQRLSGRTDASAGVTGAVTGMDRGADTATGLSMLLQQQSRQVMFKLALAEEMGVTDGLQMDAENLAQVLTGPVMIRYTNNETLSREGYPPNMTVEPEMVQGPFKFFAVGSSRSMDNPAMAGIIRSWAVEGAKDPEIRARLKVFELFKTIGEMAGIRQVNRFTKTDEEMMQDSLNQLGPMLSARLGASAPAAAPMLAGAGLN